MFSRLPRASFGLIRNGQRLNSIALGCVLQFALSQGTEAVQDKPQTLEKNTLDAYTMRVATWDTEAKLVRKFGRQDKDKSVRSKPNISVVEGVKAGTPLKVGDAITTGSKKGIALFAGAVGYQRLEPKTAVRYVSFKPPALDPERISEIEIEISKGEVQHRLGKLQSGSIYRSRSGPRLAASAGTAYSVQVKGESLEVLVAEGEVKVSLDSAPKSTLAILPRQKALIGKMLPATAVTIDKADEDRVRNLLSLPISSVIGYGDHTVLTRPDAEEIVALKVRKAFQVERATLTTATWRNFSVVVPSDSTFWTVDENGIRREVGKGLKFLAASKDGESLLGLDTESKTLFSLTIDGRRRFVQKEFESLVGASPDGKRAIIRSYFWTPIQRQDDESKFIYRKQLSTSAMDARGGQGWAVYGFNFADLLPTSKLVWFGPRNGLAIEEVREGKTCLTLSGYTGEAVSEFVSKRIFPFSEPGEWSFEYPRSGRWIVAKQTSTYRFIDTSSGMSISVPDVERYEELLDDHILRIFLKKGEVRLVKRTTDAFSPVSSNAPPVLTGTEQGEVPGVLSTSMALSPNGELVTFRDSKSGTIMVADSIDLKRDSDTYVGFGKSYDCRWISGDELLYTVPSASSSQTGEDLLIQLGVKRVGLVPTNFPGKPNGGSGIAEIADPLLPSFDELHITDVTATGIMVGFTKSSVEGSWSFQSSPESRELPDVFGANAYVQRISEGGLRWGYEQAFLPNGKVVALPEGHEYLLDWNSAVTPNGQILLNANEIWDPAVTGMSYPRGMGQPYGGRVRSLKNTPDGAEATACNSKGEILYLSKPDARQRRSFWIGKLDEIPTKGEALLVGWDVALGDDGKVYTVDVEMNNNRTTSSVYRASLTGSLEPMLEEASRAHLTSVTALADGTIYGSVNEPVGGGPEGMMEKRGAFVLREKKLLMLDPLLGAGYSISLRRISNKGAVCGRITRNGVPVLVVPNLYELLHKERALSRKKAK